MPVKAPTAILLLPPYNTLQRKISIENLGSPFCQQFLVLRSQRSRGLGEGKGNEKSFSAVRLSPQLLIRNYDSFDACGVSNAAPEAGAIAAIPR